MCLRAYKRAPPSPRPAAPIRSSVEGNQKPTQPTPHLILPRSSSSSSSRTILCYSVPPSILSVFFSLSIPIISIVATSSRFLFETLSLSHSNWCSFGDQSICCWILAEQSMDPLARLRSGFEKFKTNVYE
jgi:hypothetical protein